MYDETVRERAALLVWCDEVNDEEIARRCGIARRTLARWKLIPAFQARVEEHLAACVAEMEAEQQREEEAEFAREEEESARRWRVKLARILRRG